MAFNSWVCAVSGESIPSAFIDPDHGRITVLLSDERRIQGSYTGYGVILNPQVLAPNERGDHIRVDGIPDRWLNRQGELDVCRAWADTDSPIDYDALLEQGFDPVAMTFEQGIVVKDLHLERHQTTLHYGNLSPGGPCPHNGLFFGAADSYATPPGQVSTTQTQPETTTQWPDHESGEPAADGLAPW